MVVFDYSEHSKVKSQLYKISQQPYNDFKWRSGLKYRETIKEVDTLLTWIESLVPYVAHGLSRRGCNPDNDMSYLQGVLELNRNPSEFGGGDEFGFDPFGFTLYECWFVYYKKDDKLNTHDHFPYPITFVYYINCPEGSSPIILNGQEHTMKEGQLIFFNGHDDHSVPISTVDGRAVMTGCLAYDRARE